MDPMSIQYSMEIANAGGKGEGASYDLPDQVDLDTFNQQLNDNAAAGVGDYQVNKAPFDLTSTDQTMGDKMLAGLQNMKEGYDHQVDVVTSITSSTGPIDVKDMIKLQLDLAKLTMQGELINKTVSKSTQNIDTLLKSQ
jgi:type III secretion protein I